MNPKRISKIIKHTGKLLKVVLTEIFGDPQEKEEPNDHKTGDSGND
ncbi:MAG: hypothetical protein HOC81_03225 [Candidatus Marinimicrobia bacterium]|jgi:hypothetical protein|nr:hypothetical protein [Candidatus Neomarinimicrobiota bacterium]